MLREFLDEVRDSLYRIASWKAFVLLLFEQQTFVVSDFSSTLTVSAKVTLVMLNKCLHLRLY